MKQEHINNLISFIADTVDHIHRSNKAQFDLDIVQRQLMHTDLYGTLPADVKKHIDFVLSGILRQKEQDDHDDWYSDFPMM